MQIRQSISRLTVVFLLVGGLGCVSRAPAAESVLGGTEAETFAALKHQTPTGTAKRENVEVVGQPFTHAARLTVSSLPTNFWDVYLVARTNQALKAGEALRLTFYARKVSGEPGQLLAKLNQPGKAWDTGVVPLTTEWQKFEFAPKVSTNADAGKANVMFFVGQGVQTIEIGGISLDSGSGATVAPQISPSKPAPVAPAAAPALATGKNLIKNGDFELESTDAPPTGWVKWGKNQTNDPQAYTRDTTVAHSGKASYRIFHPAGAGGYTASSPEENSFEAEEGASYEISFWAKADAAGPAAFQVQALTTLKPIVAAKNPLGRTLDLTTEWQQFRYEINEGFNNFFADTQRYVYLTFGANTSANADVNRTIWVDDVVVTKKPAVPGVINIATLPYTKVNHRLEPGTELVINVDASHKLRRATKEATAVSFHRVNGNMGLPYNSEGQYSLTPEQEESIRSLRLPWTRLFGLGDEKFPLEQAIDGAALTLQRTGIGFEGTSLEFEDGQAKRKLSPEDWVRGINYSKSKGYPFKTWEISNEPWVRTSKRVNVFSGPDDYANHVKEVSAAIRKADPKSKIGMAFEPRWLGWGSSLLKDTAGQADFVTTHWYSFVDPTTNPFELVVAGDNYLILDQISRWNAALKAYNPGRDVYQYDTEWGLHALGKEAGVTANDIQQNGNIVGSLYRVTRLIYYTREDIVRGASAWEMFGNRSNKWNSFALLPASGDKKTMLYWTHRTFNEHLGETVLDMNGTAPYYVPTAPSDRVRGIPLGGPLTPAVVTLSEDEKTMFVTIANASWEKAVPFTLNLANFAAKSVSGIRLSNDDQTRPGLLENKEEFVSDFPVQLTGQSIKTTLPAHSAVFLTLKR